jgi:AraC family transcriptional regulator of adaptative response/methylated-DNA-[protein]-cysteine methyltransferase
MLTEAQKQKDYQYHKVLKTSWLDTQLGPMIAMSDEDGLHLLEFVDRHGLEHEIERLRFKTKAAIIPGITDSIKSVTFPAIVSLILMGALEDIVAALCEKQWLIDHEKYYV